MRGFLEQYGVAIFTLILMSILIAFASPLGKIIKTATNTQIQNIDTIASEQIQNPNRPKEPKTAQDYVYACLYNNGELIFSANEILNKENVKRDYGKVELSHTNYQIWSENASDVLTVKFETAIKPTTCLGFFAKMNNLINIQNIEYLYTNECISTRDMFLHCEKLKTINIKYLNVKNVKDMWGMFAFCLNLEELDLNKFDTKNVTNIGGMFYYCKKIETINLRQWNTSNVETMYLMFAGCSNLTTLNLTSFDTSKTLNMNELFRNTPNLKIIHVGSNWTTMLAEKNNKTTDMFKNCGTDHVTYI